MKVIVEILTGTYIDTEVSEDATVKDLMEKISLEVTLPVNRLILVIGDEETKRIVMENENETLLRDLGVREYSHMYLFFKLPDLVDMEERSREEEGDDDPMKEISSEAESRRETKEEDEEPEEEEKVKIGNEKEDKEMKNEEEDRDEKAEDQEEDDKLKNEDEAMDDDDDDDVDEETKEDEEEDN